MLIKLGKDRGSLFKKIEFFEGKTSIKTSNAVVLTGANGSGKTITINSIALAHGLGARYMSSKSSYQFSGLDMEESRSTAEGAALYDKGKKLKFGVVLRFRGDETRSTPVSLDTEEDFMAVFGMRGSHGEVNMGKLVKVVRQAREALNGGSTVLFLYDEPETGLGLDMQVMVARRLREICVGVNNTGTKLWGSKIIIATQNPFILKSCELGLATRVDLGGWKGMEDPYKELDSISDEQIKKADEEEQKEKQKEKQKEIKKSRRKRK